MKGQTVRTAGWDKYKEKNYRKEDTGGKINRELDIKITEMRIFLNMLFFF